MLLRLPSVMAETGLSRSFLYKLVAAGRFPRPVRVSPKAVAWRRDEIEEWVRSLPRGGRKV